MIEHVPLEDALAVARGVARVLRPGGRLFLSTPNIHHPWSYLRSATHVTPFCFDELGGVLTVAGLSVDGLFRCHHDSLVKGFLRRLAYPLYRVSGIDYAKSILAVAHRPDPATRPEN
jgi:SAM-dependent methyltransferase